MSKTKEHLTTETFDLDPDSFGGEDFPSFDGSEFPAPPVKKTPFPSWVSDEEAQAIASFYNNNPKLKQLSSTYENGTTAYHEKEPWIQTYSGRRFNPTNPVVGSIVLSDIAHALSMQCRFSGHVKKFYSVAQHSVLVSYLCDEVDAFWGLMHDASEAYLVDIPRPLKQSGLIQGYIELEAKMMIKICQRFGLNQEEPLSVKKADKVVLAMEARDLMSPLHPTWQNMATPAPFKIDPMNPQDAKNLFMKRFYELTAGAESSKLYEQYLASQSE